MIRNLRIIALVLLWVLAATRPAHAYIGPGAGFAVAGSMFVLLTTFVLAFGTILIFPLRLLWRLIVTGNPFKHAKVKRVVILGLDGMDPGIATRFMQEGKLPNFQKLADKGVFRPLQTSTPSMSPVAWSSFTTGVDPSRHNIYDFLTRDPCNYAPMLSSTDIRSAKKVLNIGKYVIPLGKPSIKLLQKSQAFWKLLGDKHIGSTIQRVPITFPPVKFNGLLLSGMCVPDLLGTQGTFSFFSTKQSEEGHAAFTGGEQTVLRRRGNTIRSRILGPANGMLKGAPPMTIPFTVKIAADKRSASFSFDDLDDTFTLKVGEYSEWIDLAFSAGLGQKVHGIARFCITEIDPDFNLYMTPIHIDPENPAMPISHPTVYSIYLAKKLGRFATLGLAEDTWALNERVIDEEVFYKQAMLIADERIAMFKDALQRTKKGLVTCVFDTTDRVQHMFYRYLDPTHPANAGKDTERWSTAIEQVYQRMDAMVGDLLPELDREDTTFVIMSDHGFTNFRRGVNLNAWLKENGYLFLTDDVETSGDWFESVDWSRTKAFSLGLTGMFINRKGREAKGIVAEGAEYRQVRDEICAKLKELVDPTTGEKCILDVFPATEHFEGPYRFDAPDLIIGYDGGYRNSWDCATGSVPKEVFSDNTKSWSGDHCVDPRIVPGVFFCNRPITTETPHILDMAPSTLKQFGVDIPDYMQGQPIFTDPGQGGPVSGPLDPTTLSQSGSAPGALVHKDGQASAAAPASTTDASATPPAGGAVTSPAEPAS